MLPPAPLDMTTIDGKILAFGFVFALVPAAFCGLFLFYKWASMRIDTADFEYNLVTLRNYILILSSSRSLLARYVPLSMLAFTLFRSLTRVRES